MNNQLRKIVEQAVSAVDIVTGNEALDDELAKMYIPDCFAEKFAELIVRECVQVCADRGKHHDGLYSAWASDCSERIGKHFGVEE
jgi:hypothetical protein